MTFNEFNLKDLLQKAIDEAIAKLEGIRCGMKMTSCPDQLAKALKTVEK